MICVERGAGNGGPSQKLDNGRSWEKCVFLDMTNVLLDDTKRHMLRHLNNVPHHGKRYCTFIERRAI